jgi:hypothetical protein
MITPGNHSTEVNEPTSSPVENKAAGLLDERLVYLETHSLPHLLALCLHPTPMFPPPNSSLMVIDDLPNLILGSFPRQPRNETNNDVSVPDKSAQRALTRRFQTIESIATALSRLAASRNMAIIVLSNATTSLKSSQKAILKPALAGLDWDAAIDTRIFLCRDFCPASQREMLSHRERKGYRLATVVRLAGREISRPATPFVIEARGLRQLDIAPEIDIDIDIDNADDDTNNAFTPRIGAATEEEETAHFHDTILPIHPPSSPPDSFQEDFQRASQLQLPLQLPPENQNPGRSSRASKRKASEIADSDGSEIGAEPSPAADDGKEKEEEEEEKEKGPKEEQGKGGGEGEDPDEEEMMFETHAKALVSAENRVHEEAHGPGDPVSQSHKS